MINDQAITKNVKTTCWVVKDCDPFPTKSLQLL